VASDRHDREPVHAAGGVRSSDGVPVSTGRREAAVREDAADASKAPRRQRFARSGDDRQEGRVQRREERLVGGADTPLRNPWLTAAAVATRASVRRSGSRGRGGERRGLRRALLARRSGSGAALAHGDVRAGVQQPGFLRGRPATRTL
jgi:hypothetical protein